MKTLFLCGVFADENQEEIKLNAKAPIEYSANVVQKKLIDGFHKTADDFTILSAPFIGSFPNAYKKTCFKGFKNKQDYCKYVNFCNVWGMRNFSRAKSLKKNLKDFIKAENEEKLIVVYSVHTPFLEAAVYAKKKDRRIKICLIVPDLPQYMNLNEKKSLLYRVGKKYDIKKFNKFNKFVDHYVLLTSQMKDVLNVGGRPYTVVEGIVDQNEFEVIKEKKLKIVKDKTIKEIVYAGKLNEKFGVKNLINAFLMTENENYRLILCGKGDLFPYAEEMAKKDSRIILKGQVSSDEAKELMIRSDLLVNPRLNNEEYTKYSFPSKTIEYLMTGNPIVAYKLDGMPDVYNDFIFTPNDDSERALKEKIVEVLENNLNKEGFREYSQNISEEKICKRILDFKC